MSTVMSCAAWLNLQMLIYVRTKRPKKGFVKVICEELFYITKIYIIYYYYIFEEIHYV